MKCFGGEGILTNNSFSGTHMYLINGLLTLDYHRYVLAKNSCHDIAKVTKIAASDGKPALRNLTFLCSKPLHTTNVNTLGQISSWRLSPLRHSLHQIEEAAHPGAQFHLKSRVYYYGPNSRSFLGGSGLRYLSDKVLCIQAHFSAVRIVPLPRMFNRFLLLN